MRNKKILIISVVINIVLLLVFLIGTNIVIKKEVKEKVNNLSVEVDITNDGTILVTENWDLEFLKETNEFYRTIYYHKLEEGNPFIEKNEAINNIATFSTIPNTYNQQLFKDGEELDIEKGYSFNHDLDNDGNIIGGIDRINLEVFYFETEEALIGNYQIKYQYRIEHFVTNYLDCNELSLLLIQDPIEIAKFNLTVNFPLFISTPYAYSNHALESTFSDHTLKVTIDSFYDLDSDYLRFRVLFDQDSLSITNPSQILSFKVFDELEAYEARQQEINKTKDLLKEDQIKAKDSVYIINIVLVMITIIIMVLVYLYFENIIFKPKVTYKTTSISEGLLDSSYILDGLFKKRHIFGLIKKFELNGNLERENNVLVYKNSDGLLKEEVRLLVAIFQGQKTIALEKIDYARLKKLVVKNSEYEEKPQLILFNFLFIFIFYYIIIYRMKEKLALNLIWTKVLIVLMFIVTLVFFVLLRFKKRKKYKEAKAFKNYLLEAKLKDNQYLPYYISYGIIDFK